jgi:multidrug efflux pump subunit AcrA (membrane-fusion protein)
MKKFLWITGIIVVVLVAAGFGYKAYASSRTTTTTTTKTATVTTGTVTTTASGAGTVRSGQNSTVTWNTSGEVDSVAVQLGQQVKAGDTLATLDPTSLSTSIIQAKSDLLSAQQALEDLQKPDPLKIAQAQTALNTAQTNLDNLLHPSETTVQTAQKAVLDAQDALTTAQYHFDSLKYQRGTDSQRAAAQASYIIAQTEVNRLQKIYKSTKGDPSKDAPKALALTNLSAAESKLASALALVNWYNGKPTQASIDEYTNALNLAKASLSTPRKPSTSCFTRPRMISTRRRPP